MIFALSGDVGRITGKPELGQQLQHPNSSGIMSLVPIGKGDAALFDNVIQTNFKAQPSTEVPK